jgi:hypothetical protein
MQHKQGHTGQQQRVGAMIGATEGQKGDCRYVDGTVGGPV